MPSVLAIGLRPLLVVSRRTGSATLSPPHERIDGSARGGPGARHVTLPRRTFLIGAGAAAAGLALGGCSSSSNRRASAPSRAPARTPSTVRRRAGERPDPSRPEGTDTLPGIEHVVVVMMENHSYDNYLGMLGRGAGFTRGHDGKPTNACPDAAGSPVR